MKGAWIVNEWQQLKEYRQEILLVIFHIFSKYEKNEISRSDIVDCLKESDYELYQFDEKLPYASGELNNDLEELRYKKYIKKWRTQDNLPKTLFALQPQGRTRIKNIQIMIGKLETLEEVIEARV